eukprot:Rhum_TRINITY_DN3366_c0_g1::Rhum_TRINITY_DN3366_c0_g1_i1::g.10473::m.10473
MVPPPATTPSVLAPGTLAERVVQGVKHAEDALLRAQTACAAANSEWPEAQRKLDAFLEANPGDPVSVLYKMLLSHLDGVFAASQRLGRVLARAQGSANVARTLAGQVQVSQASRAEKAAAAAAVAAIEAAAEAASAALRTRLTAEEAGVQREAEAAALRARLAGLAAAEEASLPGPGSEEEAAEEAAA